MTFIFGIAVLAGTFYAGKVYGGAVIAKATAEGLKLYAGVVKEYAVVIADIKAKETYALAAIKKYL